MNYKKLGVGSNHQVQWNLKQNNVHLVISIHLYLVLDKNTRMPCIRQMECYL